jgi:hypothetical protein
LLHVEASRARVYQFDSKLPEARQRVVHVAPLRRSHEDQVDDGQVDVTGCVGPFSPNFVVFIVLDPKGIVVFLVFCLGL